MTSRTYTDKQELINTAKSLTLEEISNEFEIFWTSIKDYKDHEDQQDPEELNRIRESYKISFLKMLSDFVLDGNMKSTKREDVLSSAYIMGFLGYKLKINRRIMNDLK